jgi:hypothetical protein
MHRRQDAPRFDGRLPHCPCGRGKRGEFKKTRENYIKGEKTNEETAIPKHITDSGNGIISISYHSTGKI